MDYSAHIVARTEHEHMQRSLAPVSDYGVPTNAEQPGWLFRQAGRLFRAVQNGMANLRRRVEVKPRISVETPLEQLRGEQG